MVIAVADDLLIVLVRAVVVVIVVVRVVDRAMVIRIVHAIVSYPVL